MLQISNLNDAISLYQPLMNATILYRKDDIEAMLETAQFRLRLLVSDGSHEINTIRIPVEDIGDAAKHLLKYGAVLQNPIDLTKDLKDSHVWFTDSDGNHIVIMGPNRDHRFDEELLSLLAN